MFHWIWILIAAQVGFILGFVCFALVRIAAEGRAEDQLANAAQDGSSPWRAA